MPDKTSKRNPLWWIPTAYIAEGIPFAMVIWVAATMFKDLGHSDGEITLALGSIGIAWSLKPFWAAFLDMWKTKKFFVLTMEFLMAGLLVVLALSLPLANYFQVIVAVLWVFAFASATQDICVDGVYLTSLDKKQQAAFVGVQGASWGTGRLFGVFVVVAVAAKFGGGEKSSWMIALCVAGAVMLALGIYHIFMLPKGSLSERPKSGNEILETLWDTLKDFFQKKSIIGMIIFILLIRCSEGLLLVLGPLFLQAPLSEGGVGLTLGEKATLDGVIGTILGISGGILGGLFISKFGLKKTFFFMALCVNMPNVCYIIMSQTVSAESPLAFSNVAVLYSIEKFGYSFGYVATMLYMMQQVSPGRFHMTHYAFCTAIMNLVLVPTQALSGVLSDHLGYKDYFIFVMIATIPSLIAAKMAPFPLQENSDPAETGT
ncbi:MFS transporter [Puniceicoccaceae bacterium K14]|nr:MFS transporter [Puniceicoccaceae bacterium K14]